MRTEVTGAAAGRLRSPPSPSRRSTGASVARMPGRRLVRPSSSLILIVVVVVTLFVTSCAGVVIKTTADNKPETVVGGGGGDDGGTSPSVVIKREELPSQKASADGVGGGSIVGNKLKTDGGKAANSLAGSASRHKYSKVGDLEPLPIVAKRQSSNVRQLAGPATPEELNKARKKSLEDYYNLASPNDTLIPTETPGSAYHWEGDIAGAQIAETGRAALEDRNMRWPSNTVYYTISAAFTADQRANVIKAMDVIQELTCVRFAGRTTEPDYVEFIPGLGCYSTVGRAGGKQDLSLGKNCLTAGPGIAMHEIMHALGFFHEQSRPDRDTYVKINWENIQQGSEQNFNKYSKDYVDTQGIPYDLGSIMHYSKTAFLDTAKAPNGFTIEPLVQSKTVVGQRFRLSDSDILRIRKYYNCAGTEREGVNPAVCKDSHDSCRGWARSGECKANPAWMLVNCQDSCGLCNVTSGCIDEDKRCGPWAAKGECTNNPGYMLFSCRLSCKNCNPKWTAASAKQCLDSNSNCPSWAKNGECTANPNWMLPNCKRSCQVCTAG